VTRGEVFITVLAEVLGKPKGHVAPLLGFLRASYPEDLRFDEDLSKKQAEGLHKDLLEQKHVLLKWAERATFLEQEEGT